MITSYSQNFEDVLLWRALKHIPAGFYIDVGAQDPTIDSVSLAFYEHGWRGVHVEPVPSYAKMLRQTRPDEVVIEAMIGPRAGKSRFFEIPSTGLSTSEEELAKKHEANGLIVNTIIVSCVTLRSIFKSYGSRDVHWLKIDVEGSEEKVLQSWLPSRVRPWVVVIESTLPTTPVASHQWEPLLIQYGYSFVFFDGLNRYYISNKHQELTSAFNAGPNVFDGFTLSGTASSTFCSLIAGKFNEQSDKMRRDFTEQLETRKQELDHLTQKYMLRGRELDNQVQSSQKEVVVLSQSIAAKERTWAESMSKIHKKVDALAQRLAQREEEYTQQLLALQKEKDVQIGKFTERLRRLSQDNIDREEELKKRLNLGQQGISNLSYIFRSFEQDVLRRLLAVQQKTDNLLGAIDMHQEKLIHFENAIQLFDLVHQQITEIILAQGKPFEGLSRFAPGRVRDLLDLPPLDFVIYAYRMLLERDPDPEGKEHHLDLLRRGESKIEIIRRIRYSREGKEAGVPIRSLWFELFIQRLARIPLIGIVFQIINGLLNFLSRSKNRRVFESEMLLTLEYMRNRHSELYKSLLSTADLIHGFRAETHLDASSSGRCALAIETTSVFNENASKNMRSALLEAAQRWPRKIREQSHE